MRKLTELDLCNNDEHITKIYKLLLKMYTESEYVKDCMMKKAKHFGYNIMLDQWENVVKD